MSGFDVSLSEKIDYPQWSDNSVKTLLLSPAIPHVCVRVGFPNQNDGHHRVNVDMDTGVQLLWINPDIKEFQTFFFIFVLESTVIFIKNDVLLCHDFIFHC